MAETNPMTEKLITEFSENYMEKLFYFCLKKTGNSAEAEDLTQDIALNILAALINGTIPTSFSAWVWRIARNRYCVWADGKHKNTESVTGADIGDYEIEDKSESTFDKLIRSEQLALLRRELAFIRSEYREIVVAHYIEEKSVRDIATSLSLSEGAVKQRLYRARNILKEGMNMAREFGVRSYKPEDIYYSLWFSYPGEREKYQPNSIMKHTLYANIFLEAYGNPSTAEELSLELGVALPYMEDELEYLTHETFLIKKDGKYQTAFPIIGSSAQEQVHIAKLTAAAEIAKTLISFVDRLNEAFTAKGYAYYGTYQDYESAKWTFLMLAFQYFAYKQPHNHDTDHPDDKKWGVIGYQHCHVSKPTPFVSNNGHSGSNYSFHQFRYEFDDADSAPDFLTEEETRILHGYTTGKIDEQNTAMASELVEKGYLRKIGETYELTIPVLKIDEIRSAVKSLNAETASELAALADHAKKQLEDLYHTISETVRSDLPAAFSEDAFRCDRDFAISLNYLAREYVLSEALRQGYLLPAGKVSPVIGACMSINP